MFYYCFSTVLLLFHYLYLKKGLSDEKIIILTDETKLNKILNNLLENALKFTHEGFIEFGYTIASSEHTILLQLYVKDIGIGIRTENQEIIFKRFEKLSNKSSATGNMWWLIICKAGLFFSILQTISSSPGINNRFKYLKAPGLLRIPESSLKRKLTSLEIWESKISKSQCLATSLWE